MKLYKCRCCGKEYEYHKLYMLPPYSKYFCKVCLKMASLLSTSLGLDDEPQDVITAADCNPLEQEEEKAYFPKDIKAYLDKYVVGQDDAKKALSVALFHHHKRIEHNTLNDEKIAKSNILLMGPSGSGKTHLVKTIAKLFDVPYVIADATTFTEVGYIGSDVETLLTMLVSSSNKDFERVKSGIVFIDEIDKLAGKKASNGTSHTANNIGVQQALLKMLEGTEVMIPLEFGKNVDYVKLDTSNILFICGGAFPDLEKIIRSKEDIDLKEDESIFSYVTDEDLQNYGFIPEFIGRLPIITTLNNLNKEDLRKILTEPKNSFVWQYKQLFKQDDIELEFTEEALNQIAINASQKKRGARGLKSELDKILNILAFELPGKFRGKVTITKDCVNGTNKPLLQQKKLLDRILFGA